MCGSGLCGMDRSTESDLCQSVVYEVDNVKECMRGCVWVCEVA